MISRKTLLVLAVSALAAVATAALLTRERTEPAPTNLFPDLAGRVGDLAEIRIASRQGEVTLARHGERWLVRERDDHPASGARLREALQGITGLSTPEAKTRDPKLYERIGLDPEKGEKPGRIELRDRAGTVVASLWVGKAKALVNDVQRQEYFVRRGDEAQVWRVEGRLPLDAAPQFWIDKQVLKLDRARIRAIAVAPRAEVGYRIVRESAEQDEFAVKDLGTGEAPESALRVNSLASAIQNLSADDVLGPPAAASLSGHGRVSVETFDGLKVEIELFAADGRRYARLAASGGDTEAVNQEVARLNDRWRNWTYQLADYQADALFAKRVEFVKSSAAATKAPSRRKPAAPSAKPGK